MIELIKYCQLNDLKLNVMTDTAIDNIGDISFTSTPFGAVQRVKNLEKFSLTGGKMRRLRYLVSKFEKVGNVKTSEYINGTDTDIDKSVVEVIDQWCSDKTQINPLVEKAREDIKDGKLDSKHRLFITHVDERLVNVILITPVSSPCNGYLMDLEFYPSDMPLGGLEYTVVKIIKTLSSEGCSMLSLGATLGPKLEPSPNADSELDVSLDELREHQIFNDQGNLQFKNKFRPENKTIFLCHPNYYKAAEDIVDVIMMIADPGQPGVFPPIKKARLGAPNEFRVLDLENKNSESSQSDELEELIDSRDQKLLATINVLGPRARTLLGAGFNPGNLNSDKVLHDLRTDSWAQLDNRFIGAHIQNLYANIHHVPDVNSQLESIFNFKHIFVTSNGASAEKILCSAWPTRGVVYQSILFPTLIFNLIDNGFSPKEIPHASIYSLKKPEHRRSEINLDSLVQELDDGAEKVSFVCLELTNNAAGGFPVSLDHLAKIKEVLTKFSIPLVLDATRILENARNIINQIDDYRGVTIWTVVREICSYADVITASLAKDFCVDRGGVIATNDEYLYRKFKKEYDSSGERLNVIDKKIIASALDNKSAIETCVESRVGAVRQVCRILAEQGIPVVEPALSHCVLIDIKQLKEFSSFKQPVASFLACLYLNTGIRCAGHNVGMQKNTSLNNLVRLAIPLGMKSTEINEITEKLVLFFRKIANIPKLVIADHSSKSYLKLHAKYDVEDFLRIDSNAYIKSEVDSEVADLIQEEGSKLQFSKDSQRYNASEQNRKVAHGGEIRSSHSNDSLVIAIVGVSGRYPGANNTDQLWENLLNARDSICDIPADRLEKRRSSWHKESYKGGFIDSVDQFDSLFFNISPREAEMLDPQERLLLEVAWEALEDGGYYPEILEGKELPIQVLAFLLERFGRCTKFLA